MSLPSLAEIRACLAADCAWESLWTAVETEIESGDMDDQAAAEWRAEIGTIVADYCEERARQIAQMIAHAEGRP